METGMTTTTTEPPRKAANIQLHARPETKALIGRAAEAAHKTITDFVLDAARREAEDVLRDRTQIVLSTEDFDAFTALLDDPPPLGPAMTKLLTDPDPWRDAPAGGPA